MKFPIVAIGASAGGLDAAERFLANVPPDCGMAFILVQHMDPTREGMMPELLQRRTLMQVLQVKEPTQVQPNCVYVIPPGKDMSIRNGILHLHEPTERRGLRLPIDFFFHSLAKDRREYSIGVILSGMGADGTQGLRAIKENSGLVLVQDPETAKFDAMPRSALDAGLADIVAPADELPGRIVAHLQHIPIFTPGKMAPDDKTRNDLDRAILLLRAHTGQDFTLYKKNTLCRRIERRMAIHQIHRMPEYVQYLKENLQERDLLFKELLIGVTNFFRDPAAWDPLCKEVIPQLLAGRPPGHVLRAWVPGCSTGEEAFSLAMVFKEALDESKRRDNYTLQIFATDLDRDSIDKARQGLFPETIVDNVSAARLSRFFMHEERGYRVQRGIRDMVIFAPQNLIMDPPFTRLDLITCRNLLIYLAAEVQRKLIPLFHYSLAPGGFLFLGSAETVGSSGLFTPLAGKSRIFRRTETAAQTEPVEFPPTFSAKSAGTTAARPLPKTMGSLQSLADRWIMEGHSSPAVLVNDQGDIFYFNGRTGKYLEPAAGKANWNIFAMAREGLRYELASAFQKALRKNARVHLHLLTIGTDTGKIHVDVTLERIEEPGPLQGLVMIVFTDMPAPPVLSVAVRGPNNHVRSARVAELERDLQQVRIEARATQENMRTFQEELRSANEELQSTNEELQSTNEELTTSKEEMQSMNEELQTLNAELQAKVDELSRASNDMKNLLDSTNIATLFLDRDLNVRRFTTEAKTFVKLIPGDVGRPITDLVLDLSYGSLADDARDVLRTLVPTENLASAPDGRWFNVRIMPYRTMDDRIDGVVITFADVTTAKHLEPKADDPAKETAVIQRVSGRRLPSSSVVGGTRKGHPRNPIADAVKAETPSKPELADPLRDRSRGKGATRTTP